MSKKDIKSIIIFVVFICGFFAVILWSRNYLAKSVSDYEVITPKEGIECVVVSRSYNTSVDCWKVEP